ncbi:electron transfer flavoprotein subunit beta/FixA family protein [Paenibacillus sp. Marseille-P2973]|uniref:electron transfer flavoprotein subunit beta/FixA family protein n=1 Tax=Paenibacillus sp. Marseille-P2973 TaxID=1871032 RepID=UPI001B37B04A|nr:electron transfer flavoprotein subunit beta/FixA family protein [Paenibacillus sp. Marseille-P2973]MBQ4901001.1 electron transfer flavoprotein subunit beta/FixA family protein [Paenibacillus sp. Marseille-P2973]
MNIYVILKQTFDTEEKVVIQNGEILDDGVKYIINPYDEYAVEEALRLKEQHGGTVIVVSVGPDRTAEALRTALAMGADEAVLISDPSIRTDESGIAALLASYFGSQSYDLILGGYFSVDNGAGQVAVRLAQLLDIPHASAIVKLDVSGGQAVAVRDAEGDSETVEISLPALFTAQQGLNEPRYPSLPGIMKAKKKPFQQLGLNELGIDAESIVPKTERIELFNPPERKAGIILQGGLAEQAAELVRLLKTEAKVL